MHKHNTAKVRYASEKFDSEKKIGFAPIIYDSLSILQTATMESPRKFLSKQLSIFMITHGWSNVDLAAIFDISEATVPCCPPLFIVTPCKKNSLSVRRKGLTLYIALTPFNSPVSGAAGLLFIVDVGQLFYCRCLARYFPPERYIPRPILPRYNPNG